MLASRFGSNRNTIRSNAPLSEVDMRRVAPSIFAESAHESRSDRYAYIPTFEVVKALQKNGFQPFMVAQTKVRDDGHREHTKHLIRFRHATEIERADKHEAMEVILLNSHNGASSYQMLSGMFRFVCANGLIIGDTLQDVRIRHSGDVLHSVQEGAHTILDGSNLVREVRDEMRRISLSNEEQRFLAEGALALRYPDADEMKPAPIAPDRLLKPRRVDDLKSDLWTTFNVIQENTIKGGAIGRSKNGRSVRQRAVTGMDQDKKLNQQLWILAEKMRELKS